MTEHDSAFRLADFDRYVEEHGIPEEDWPAAFACWIGEMTGLDALRARGFTPETCAMDKGYDNNRVMDETRERGVAPVVCLRKGRPIPLTPIPYGSDEWKRLYRGRAAVEREFGRLKNEYALTPLRTRGLARVRQHADLVMIARLGQALIRARAFSLAA